MTRDESAAPPPGTIPRFLAGRLGYLTPRRFTYGPPVRIGLRRQLWLLTGPDDVFHVLVAGAGRYAKSRNLSTEQGARRAGRGLLTRTGAEHHRRRRLLGPLFAQTAVEAYSGSPAAGADRMLDAWTDGRPVAVDAALNRLATDALFACLFGSLARTEADALRAAIAARRRHTEAVYFSRIPGYARLPSPAARAARHACGVIGQITRRHLADRRRQPGTDLLSALARLEDGPEGRLDTAAVVDEVLALMTTGHETITEWLTWAIDRLAREPDVQARLHREVDAAPAGVTDREALPYTHQVLDESLRLDPPTWLFARVPQVEDRLPSGLAVGPRHTLLVCPYLMHRHPGHFPDPEAFRPERFADPTLARLSGRVYLPFGAGPHRCIGDKFARLEAATTLAALGRRFWLEPVEPVRPTPVPGLTLHPGRPVRVVPRVRE